MDGEQCGDFLKGTPRACAAIAAAYPMPRTIGEAMAEVKVWNKLRWDRGVFHDDIYGYNEEPEVHVRTKMVEDFLATAPVQNWQDLEDRFAWKKYEFESEYLDPVVRNDPFMDRIEDDFRILRDRATTPTQSEERLQPAQNGQRRTNADKATMVREILTAEPSLSDREISRRAGVSPQTVSNWRARLKNDHQKGA
ncbi:winged helix-turn-helix domain-containing protein [Metarhizobium album]|uniref:Winged helix-turn-helix domain-containing protein n=2 Tax=Metarhizobium album TaxID=2182425 RepID=A0A2U2DHY9_9HYPH|nr:winged helix-turn-helix domain-containing protein [Rhizobium album]